MATRLFVQDLAATATVTATMALVDVAVPVHDEEGDLERKGRGHALRTAWSQSDSPVLAYMDVDLHRAGGAAAAGRTAALSGHSDVSTGSRLSPGARVVRGRRREVISRCYNQILRRTLHARFRDAQCGFKAVSAPAARRLLPLVRDDNWFFDTELRPLAQRMGMRIREVPVDWVDDPDSRVTIVPTAIEDLRGVWRLMHHG